MHMLVLLYISNILHPIYGLSFLFFFLSTPLLGSLPDFLANTLSSARRVSDFSGKVEGSKYCGEYSSNHSGRTSVTVRMN
jgi:hypothetical protein